MRTSGRGSPESWLERNEGVSAPTPDGIRQEITDLTGLFVLRGFALDAQYPVLRDVEADGLSTVGIPGSARISAALRNQRYRDLYIAQVESRSYNMRLVDGALLQFDFEFRGRALTRSRLAYLPEPDKVDYLEDQQSYLEGAIFSEISDLRGVGVPIRFDYDGRPGVAKPVTHPASHVTLGQYSHCRVPASAPITAGAFTDLIIDCFYTDDESESALRFPLRTHRFPTSIAPEEKAKIHFMLP